MKCPACKTGRTKVIDSRTSNLNIIRRRRLCLSCEERFTTYEQPPDAMATISQDSCGRAILERAGKAKFIKLMKPLIEFLSFHFPEIIDDTSAYKIIQNKEVAETMTNIIKG